VVVAAADATFRPWYATVGFAPDGGWTALLPSVVGRSRAADVLLTDREITADEALEWGLAHQVVPAAEVPAAAQRVARRIASLRPGAVAAIRRLTAPSRDEVAAALEDERRAFVALVAGEEASAGLDAFLGGDSR
jgi:2-(1,2-epoxy-1,2-dihydrophenyl)acetyl-CoA isomerase